MRKLIGNYDQSLIEAAQLIDQAGIDEKDLVQCDTICYRVETNQRYEDMKYKLGARAILLDESPVNGRLITVFRFKQPLSAVGWESISYLELPQPKPNSHYVEGIDHLQFVTRQSLSDFREKYAEVDFEEKGLTNQLNPLLKLVGETISVKFHDKHMGSVIELEKSVHED